MGEPSSADGAGPPAWFLVGPTASGKNGAAVPLARELGAEILVLDSMKVFRGMDIGTAKPDAAMRDAVPHHLLDLVAPSEPFDIQQYLAAVDVALADLDGRGVPALFVGGTHLYLKALLNGVWVGPPPDPALRAALQGREDLSALLAEVDPESAARLHPNDRRRIIRAIEVHRTTGRPLSSWQREATRPHLRRPYRGLVAVRDRGEMYARIDARIPRMFAAGWVDEVAGIEAGGGFGPQSRHAIGYQEIREALASGRDPGAAVPRIEARTHYLARKQLNWLRRFEGLREVALDGASGSDASTRVLEAAGELAAGAPVRPGSGRWLR